MNIIIEDLYVTGQIPGVIIIELKNMIKNKIIWKINIRHDGGVDHVLKEKRTQYINQQIDDLKWIIQNDYNLASINCFSIYIKPNSQAYLISKDNEYSLLYLPRFMDMVDSDIQSEIQRRNHIFIHNLKNFITSNNTHKLFFNIDLYLKFIIAVNFDENKISSDKFSMELICQDSIS